MAGTVSGLRHSIHRLLDKALETGQAMEIKRKGRILRVIPQPKENGKLARLVRHPCIKGDAEELVHVDWDKAWGEARGLL